MSCLAENLAEAAGMVVVAMAEDDCLGCGRVDAERRGVGGEREPLPGVEEDPAIAQFDPDSQAVLRQQAPAADAVVGQDHNSPLRRLRYLFHPVPDHV